MVLNNDHISVCICTYKRPQLLEKLLIELQKQKTGRLFTYSIVVVDNDHAKSAKNVITNIEKKTLVDIDYYVEPEKNISLARNKSILNAHGNFIAFIDDDEFPVNEWLFNLYKTYNDFKADGVLGPVKAHFDNPPPQWITRAKLFEKIYEEKTHNTGEVLHWGSTRSGNVLLKREIFEDENNIFEPQFGRIGGGDVVFFKKLVEKGFKFIWCDEAPVYETVLPERWEKSYFLRRALLQGRVSLKYYRKGQSRRNRIRIILKTVTAFFAYTLALPFLYIAGEHIFMKYLIKDFHHIGRLLALFGIAVVKERNY